MSGSRGESNERVAEPEQFAVGQLLWKEGYPDDCFQDASIANDMLCSICALVSRHPMQCVQCSQMYCSLCLRRWMLQNEGNTCPMCRTELVVSDLVRDASKQDRIETALTACQQCEWTGPFGEDGATWAVHTLATHPFEEGEERLFEFLPEHAPGEMFGNFVAALGADDGQGALLKVAGEYVQNVVRDQFPVVGDMLARPDAAYLMRKALLNTWLSNYIVLLAKLATVDTQRPYFRNLLARTRELFPNADDLAHVDEAIVPVVQHFVRMMRPVHIAMRHHDTESFFAPNANVEWFASANFESDEDPERELYACCINEVWEELEEEQRISTWELFNGLWAIGELIPTLSPAVFQQIVNLYLSTAMRVQRDPNGVIGAFSSAIDQCVDVFGVICPSLFHRVAVFQMFVAVICPMTRRDDSVREAQQTVNLVYPLIPRYVIDTLRPYCPPDVRSLLDNPARLDLIEVLDRFPVSVEAVMVQYEAGEHPYNFDEAAERAQHAENVVVEQEDDGEEDNEEVDNEEVDNEEVDNEEVDNEEVDNEEVDNEEVDNEEVDNEEHCA